MKIAFVSEIFLPYSTGGAEISVLYLAKELKKQGHQPVIITPNYGSNDANKNYEVPVIRFPIYRKLRNHQTPGNFFFTNPIWFLWSTFWFWHTLKKTKADIVSIQGKYSVPPVYFASKLLKKPVVFTARDYIPVCNYGLCLIHSSMSCNLINYFTKDFASYYKTYVVNKNIPSLIANLSFAVWGRLSTYMLKFFIKKVRIVTLSKAQKNIYEINGYKVEEIIHNSFVFQKNKPSASKRKNVVVFSGRLSYGKGVHLLINLLEDFFQSFPNYEFYFLGKGLYEKDLKRKSKKYKGVKLFGHVDHGKVIALISNAKSVVVPSLWPEPFGRVALESLSHLTPVVITNRGALPEIIDNKMGVVVGPKSSDILNGIRKVMLNNDLYIKNISEQYTKLAKKYQKDVAQKYLDLFERIK